MAGPVDGNGMAVGDRGLIEEAARLLIAAAPAGWTHLRAEFEPSAEPPTAIASVTNEQGGEQPLTASPEIFDVVVKHQRRAAASGAPWLRLVIDCHSDGRLSAWTDSATDQRWLRRGLAAITAGCLIASAAVFALAWEWAPPPRVAMIALPPPPPRQQEAFDVIVKWFAAQNRSDAAGMRALSCATPGKDLADWTATIQYHGNYQADYYPDAITSFTEDAGQYRLRVAERFHPLDQHMRREAEWAERDSAGFVYDRFVLVDEHDDLKICDIETSKQ